MESPLPSQEHTVSAAGSQASYNTGLHVSDLPGQIKEQLNTADHFEGKGQYYDAAIVCGELAQSFEGRCEIELAKWCFDRARNNILKYVQESTSQSPKEGDQAYLVSKSIMVPGTDLATFQPGIGPKPDLVQQLSDLVYLVPTTTDLVTSRRINPTKREGVDYEFVNKKVWKLLSDWKIVSNVDTVSRFWVRTGPDLVLETTLPVYRLLFVPTTLAISINEKRTQIPSVWTVDQVTRKLNISIQEIAQTQQLISQNYIPDYEVQDLFFSRTMEPLDRLRALARECPTHLDSSQLSGVSWLPKTSKVQDLGFQQEQSFILAILSTKGQQYRTFVPNLCYVCGKDPDDDIFKEECKNCKMVVYCNADCKLDDRDRHATICWAPQKTKTKATKTGRFLKPTFVGRKYSPIHPKRRVRVADPVPKPQPKQNLPPVTRQEAKKPRTPSPDLSVETVRVQPKASLHGSGLPNLGATCFMNSVLQSLIHTPKFNEVLERFADMCFNKSDCPCLKGFCQIASKVKFEIKPSPSKASTLVQNLLRSFLSNATQDKWSNEYVQQDAMEFLAMMLDSVSEELKSACRGDTELPWQIKVTERI